MTTLPGRSGTVWRKSSYSDGGEDNCIEVADGFTYIVPVRDSKVPDGPVLCVPVGAWTSFIETVKDGRL